ncbi:MAG TPA: hypothetical protein PK122_06725 [Candidatus Paceibacterota bacterium]|nr:hypothetical protein [Candidatus Paceibacterota bacterium]
MRAKFIRGGDPKDLLGIGVDGEVLKVGYYGDSNDQMIPVEEPNYRAHDLFANWLDLIDDDYVFKYRRRGTEDTYSAGPDDLEGKTIIYDGKIYSIPRGPIPPV